MSESRTVHSFAELPDEAWVQGEKCDVVGRTSAVVLLMRPTCYSARGSIEKLNRVAELCGESVKIIGLARATAEELREANFCDAKFRIVADPERKVYSKYNADPFRDRSGVVFVIHDNSAIMQGSVNGDDFISALNLIAPTTVTKYDFMRSVPAMPDSVEMIKGTKPDFSSDMIYVISWCSSLSGDFDALNEFIAQRARKFASAVQFILLMPNSDDSLDHARAAAERVDGNIGIDQGYAWAKAIFGYQGSDDINEAVTVITRYGKLTHALPVPRLELCLFDNLSELLGQRKVLELSYAEE